MNVETTVITLSKQEIIRLEMIVIDKDKDEAFAFVRDLKRMIESNTIKGLKSHLDK